MEKKIIYIDQRKIDLLKLNLDFCLPRLQDVQTEFCNILPRALTLEEIKNCYVIAGNSNIEGINHEAIRSLIFDIIIEQTESKMFGQKINRKRAQELIEMPDLMPLYDTCEKLTEPIPGIDYLDWNFFDVSKKSITINETRVQQFKEECTSYAETADEISRFEKAEVLIENIYDLCKVDPELKPQNMVVPGVLTWDLQLQKLRVNTDFVLKKRNKKTVAKVLSGIEE